MARGQGRVFQKKGSKKWHIEYWWRGKQHREARARTASAMQSSS